MSRDYRDQVIEALADEVAMLEEAKRQLIDLVADLAWDLQLLRLVAAYRCDHNPDLLDRLWTTAKAFSKQKRAA